MNRILVVDSSNTNNASQDLTFLIQTDPRFSIQRSINSVNLWAKTPLCMNLFFKRIMKKPEKGRLRVNLKSIKTANRWIQDSKSTHKRPNYLIAISRKTGNDSALIVLFASGESREKLFTKDLSYRLKKIIQTEILEVLFRHRCKQLKI